ncbi:RCC1/BLIP-II [Yamadazyma tenuis ATCC 10573]|nr:RCC1/BLIP-II [Yamadazyma tenuis ATCC 10573]EGV65898.1 RCC1/BLIP-II [Yamadazyma tenuis ATCC 10573]
MIRGRHHHSFVPHGSQTRASTNVNLRSPPEQLPSLNEFITNAKDTSNQASQASSTGDSNSNVESNFVTRIQLPIEAGTIISISSGRQHFIALDNKDQIFTWDTGSSSIIGIRMAFPEITPASIIKIKCGWNLSGFNSKDQLVVWYSRDPLTKQQVETSQYCSNASYLCFEAPDLIDFHLGNDFVILLMPAGAFVYPFDIMHYYGHHSGEGRTDIPFSDLDRLEPLNNWLTQHNSGGTRHRFSKINGCYNSFVVFCNGKSILGNKRTVYDGENVEEVQLPDGVEAVELEMGDYHYLALTDKGDVYSWGIESNGCGCLGVGDYEEKRQEGRNSSRVMEPVRVEGQWVAVAAAGWHSAGIRVSSSEEVFSG